MAFGILGLSPGEFDAMTPGEFANKVKGFLWMEERRSKEQAWALVNIMNVCGNLKKGHSVKMNKLYRPLRQDPENPYYRMLLGS
jgi:hypothetical protein